MNPALRKYIEAASSVGNITKANAERLARQLVRQGGSAGEQVGDLVDELMNRQKRNREAVVELVRAETKRAVRNMGVATSTEVERLQKQVADLQRELKRVEGSVGATKAASKKSTTRKSPAKKKSSKKSSTKKASTKKGSTKKAGAKKSTAKKGSKKSSSKKAGAKKSSGS